MDGLRNKGLMDSQEIKLWMDGLGNKGMDGWARK